MPPAREDSCASMLAGSCSASANPPVAHRQLARKQEQAHSLDHADRSCRLGVIDMRQTESLQGASRPSAGGRKRLVVSAWRPLHNHGARWVPCTPLQTRISSKH